MPARSSLHRHLSRKRNYAKKTLHKRHPHARIWLENKKLDLAKLRQHSARVLAGAALGGAMVLVSPKIKSLGTPSFSLQQPQVSPKEFLTEINSLPQKIPQPISEEEQIKSAIRQLYGVNATFELDGNRLPAYRGIMGLEQHLYRYPGDTLDQHQFPEEGFAPLLGAFEYFSRPGVSKERWAEEEKYYLVLQTFLIPTWNRDWVTLKPWYAFRKFVAFNPEKGQAVVGVLGDSGPAVWMKRAFGGSPEVMQALGFYPARTSGETIMLFLDDPENKIPLGPLPLKGENV